MTPVAHEGPDRRGNDQQEHDFLENLLTYDVYFIGLSCMDGQCSWVDGSEESQWYTLWYPGEPNGNGNTCVIYGINGQWKLDDASCNDKKYI